jgi:hypothetical protein
MSWIDALIATVRPIVRRGRADREMSDELAFHLEQERAKNLAAGMAYGDLQPRAGGTPAATPVRRSGCTGCCRSRPRVARERSASASRSVHAEARSPG